MSKQKKPRKVSFKLFLNKALTPEKEGFYPVYLRITYKGQNTKVPDVLMNNTTLFWTEEDLSNFEKGKPSTGIRGNDQFLKSSLDFYEDIIRYEDPDSNDNYSIGGFAERVRFYRLPIYDDFLTQLSYYFNVEQALLYDQDKIESKTSFEKLNEETKQIVPLLSPGLKRLIEAYLLVKLYGLDQYHEYQNDLWFGDTYYHWVIKDGMTPFKRFLADFFGDRQNINDDYLSTLLANNTPFKRELGNLLNILKPEKEFSKVYTALIKNHFELMIESFQKKQE